MQIVPEENDKHIQLVIDQRLLDKYTKYYFLQHPRARKVPIEKPWHPSINQWSILPRIQMNDQKQKWKLFGEFVIKYNKLDGMMLDNYDVISTIYYPTKARHDPDNGCPKWILDSWTEAGFVKDDSEKYMHSLTLKTGYDKENPRTEFDIYYR